MSVCEVSPKETFGFMQVFYWLDALYCPTNSIKALKEED